MRKYSENQISNLLLPYAQHAQEHLAFTAYTPFLNDAVKSGGQPYHNGYHVYEVCAFIDNFKFDLSDRERALLILAAFYHDYIYNPAASNNEELSVLFFQKQFLYLFDKETISKAQYSCSLISKLIKATKDHKIPSDIKDYEKKLFGIFLDSDMAILFAPWPRYSEYMQGVWQEYTAEAWYKEDFRKGRSDFLKKLLDNLDSVFYTDLAKSFAPVARENIQRELLLLTEKQIV